MRENLKIAGETLQKEMLCTECQWLTPVILTTQEAEIRIKPALSK
jgi:hypothetical protein